MWDVVTKESAPLQEIQAQVKAASPPPVAELDEELARSEDPKIVEFREAIKRAEESLKVAREDAHRHLLQGYKTLSEDELKDLTNKYAQQYNRVRKAVGMLRDYGEMMSNTTGVVEAVDKYRIPNLRSVAGNKGRTSIEGGPRPSITSCTIVRADGKSRTDKKISVLAAWSKLTSADIYAAWFKAAGVSQWQDVTDTHEFKVGDCTITIVPREADSEE
jgi:hypothetical protein